MCCVFRDGILQILVAAMGTQVNDSDSSLIFIDFRLDSDSRKRTHEYFEKQLKSLFNLNIYITDIQKADRSRTPAFIWTANIFQRYIL